PRPLRLSPSSASAHAPHRATHARAPHSIPLVHARSRGCGSHSPPSLACRTHPALPAPSAPPPAPMALQKAHSTQGSCPPPRLADPPAPRSPQQPPPRPAPPSPSRRYRKACAAPDSVGTPPIPRLSASEPPLHMPHQSPLGYDPPPHSARFPTNAKARSVP